MMQHTEQYTGQVAKFIRHSYHGLICTRNCRVCNCKKLAEIFLKSGFSSRICRVLCKLRQVPMLTKAQEISPISISMNVFQDEDCTTINFFLPETYQLLTIPYYFHHITEEQARCMLWWHPLVSSGSAPHWCSNRYSHHSREFLAG